MFFIFLLVESFIYAGNLETNFNIVFDAEYLSNIDDVVEHYAVNSPTNFLTNVSQTNFSISSKLINEKDRKLDGVLEFDFMGDNGFEIVSAYLNYQTGGFYIKAGKSESLVATTEKSLDYDGYYSTGGIQTGVLANMRQLQIGLLKNELKFSILITDELPSAGGVEAISYYLKQPALELALSFEKDSFNSKVASHFAKINTETENSFNTLLIMNETNVNINNSFRFKISGFYSEAGSQFFVVEEMFDFYFLDGKINTVKNYGSYAQLICSLDKSSFWIGAGGFFTKNDDVENLKSINVNFLKSNTRISAGIEYEVLPNTMVSFEYSKFSTKRIENKLLNKYIGNSFHFQISIEF